MSCFALVKNMAVPVASRLLDDAELERRGHACKGRVIFHRYKTSIRIALLFHDPNVRGRSAILAIYCPRCVLG